MPLSTNERSYRRQHLQTINSTYANKQIAIKEHLTTPAQTKSEEQN